MGLTNASCVPEVRMCTMRTCVPEVQFSSQIKFEPKMPAKNGLHTNFLKSREITIALYCILLLDDVGSFFSWGPINEMYPREMGPYLEIWTSCLFELPVSIIEKYLKHFLVSMFQWIPLSPLG